MSKTKYLANKRAANVTGGTLLATAVVLAVLFWLLLALFTMWSFHNLNEVFGAGVPAIGYGDSLLVNFAIATFGAVWRFWSFPSSSNS